MPAEENEHVINAGTNVRFPIGLLASLVVAIAVFLYAQNVSLRSLFDERFNYFEERLDGKADAVEPDDRYTGSDANRDKEILQISNASLRREFIIHIDSIKDSITELRVEHNNDILHMHSDLEKHGHNHDDIVHDPKH